jgi:DNA repair protein RecO (recombination protein O)
VRGIQTEALILRAVDFGESDRILHLLVPQTGRLTAIAKGARRSVRRFAGTLDLFNHLLVEVDLRRPTTMARLDQARLIESFDSLRVDPVRFGLGCYLLELFDRLAPDGGSPADMQRLFRFALGALRAISLREPDARLRTLLELRALDALGLCPELRRCVRCGADAGSAAQVDFHVAEGGTVCAACAARLDGLLRVHLGTLRALEQGLRFDFDRLDRLAMGQRTLAEAQELMSRFQRFHLGVELRSERFLARILQESSPG